MGRAVGSTEVRFPGPLIAWTLLADHVHFLAGNSWQGLARQGLTPV
jgi:hypothetical protein